MIRKNNIVLLSDADVKELNKIIKKKTTTKSVANRCRVLLAIDKNHPPCMTYDQCVDALGVSKHTVVSTVNKFSNGGIEAVTANDRNVKSDISNQKINKQLENIILTVASSPAPKYYSRWTLRLIKQELAEKEDLSICVETIRKVLKQNGISL